MSRHHRGQRHRYPLSSGVRVDVNGDVVSSPTASSTAEAASADLRVGYTYPLAAYLNPGIRYPCCPLDGTVEAAAEAEAVSDSASSDL